MIFGSQKEAPEAHPVVEIQMEVLCLKDAKREAEQRATRGGLAATAEHVNKRADSPGHAAVRGVVKVLK